MLMRYIGGGVGHHRMEVVEDSTAVVDDQMEYGEHCTSSLQHTGIILKY